MQPTNKTESPGGRLEQIRTVEGLSQKEMAERLGISIRGYQTYERCERDVPSSVAVTVFQEFGVRPLWLLAGIEQAPPTDVRWTADMLKAIEDAAANLLTILARSKEKLDPKRTGQLIAHFAQYEITEDEKIVEALRIAGITPNRKQR